MVGDALGMPVEGFEQSEIRQIAQARWGTDLFQDFIPAVPMGTFVPGAQPGVYRAATKVSDGNFVPTGPTSNKRVAEQCARTAMYTDDTNAALALASSISECGRVDSEHAARRCAEFFRDNEAYRGCPPTAKMVMEKTLAGVSIDETGLPPHFPFEGGSFANGGAMRISPLAIAYLHADAPTLRRAVAAAVRGSHRHPEAVDFALVQAAAVQYALRTEPAHFDSAALLADLASRCETEAMQCAVTDVAAALQGTKKGNEQETVRHIVDARCRQRPGSGMGFQIASVHMAPCVLWCACRHHREPCAAIQAAIDLGGDTDTTASMVGAIVGALHGEGWCKDWAPKLENGLHGRDFALDLGERLSQLDVQE